MPKPPRNIEKNRGKRADLARWVEQMQPPSIGESELGQLRIALAPISENYLRRLLRDSGVPLHPMIEGVRQAALDELEVSLLALLDEYEPGDAARRAEARRLVMVAKDHARWAARDPAKRIDKEEMILWMITWLENPPVFREWVKLRRARL